MHIHEFSEVYQRYFTCCICPPTHKGSNGNSTSASAGKAIKLIWAEIKLTHKINIFSLLFISWKYSCVLWQNALSHIFWHMVTTHAHVCSGMLWKNMFSGVLWQNVNRCVLRHLVTTPVYDFRALMTTHVFTCVATRCIFTCFQVFGENAPGMDTSEHLCCDNTQLHIFSGGWQQHTCSLMFTRSAYGSNTWSRIWRCVATTCLFTSEVATHAHACPGTWWQHVFTHVEPFSGKTCLHVLRCVLGTLMFSCVLLCDGHVPVHGCVSNTWFRLWQ